MRLRLLVPLSIEPCSGVRRAVGLPLLPPPLAYPDVTLPCPCPDPPAPPCLADIACCCCINTCCSRSSATFSCQRWSTATSCTGKPKMRGLYRSTTLCSAGPEDVAAAAEAPAWCGPPADVEEGEERRPPAPGCEGLLDPGIPAVDVAGESTFIDERALIASSLLPPPSSPAPPGTTLARGEVLAVMDCCCCIA